MVCIGILSTGSYLPARVVGNDEIAGSAGVSAEWIVRKTGIAERRRAATHEASSDLAATAALRALDQAGLSPAQVDYVVVATSTPDHPQPATASIVQHLIGAESAGAFDMNAVCSGFVYALMVTERLLRGDGGGGYGVVVGVDIYSRILDYSDRRTAALFGDGAGAVVLGPVSNGAGLADALLMSRGDLHSLIQVPAGGSRLPASESTLEQGRHFFTMDGRGVRDFVREQLPGAVRELLRRGRVRADEVRHFIPHQANGAMLADLVPTLGLTAAHTHLTVDRYGNTGAASIPITLDAAYRRGSIGPGDLVLLAGFGGGMSVGASLVRWTSARQSPPVPAPAIAQSVA
ncbi:3-oxoacyl-ACP synthase III family protein [Actinomadura rubrisoli]|uniref:Ketoacyl-ACP synthase III n=1 Tax=Actinomadura rubrisoli TaxID=2530368 RepID=A0A4R5C6G1_9ACTN|nr:ketoacyl-ACP synthase III [Actinomadura rubrisoli]TDD92492.1 ketoacyl-ACP synthase III [Actinomadura rubrisoli]